jgi:hypothetical protein
MNLAIVIEYGAALAEYPRLLRDVAAQGERSGSSCLIAAVGCADLVEIRRCRSYEELYLTGTSGSHLFQRSFAVLEPDLSVVGDAGWIRPLVDQMAPDLERPFLAVTYAKLSPLVSLAVPPQPAGPSLVGSLIGAMTRDGKGLWGSTVDTFRRSVGSEEELRLRACPLVGLGPVEIVVVTRFRRFEEIAAFTSALRHLEVRDLLPAETLQPTLERASALLGQGVGQEEWNRSALLLRTATVVGAPLRLEGGVWRPQGGITDEVAASAARISTRTVLTPGRRQEAGDRELPPTLQPVAAAGSPLMLFDRFDLLHLDPAVSGVGTLTVGAVLHYIRKLMEEPGASVLSATEIAIGGVVPPDEASQASGDLLDRLFERLRQRRRHHVQEGEGWIARWNHAASVGGLVQPLADSVPGLVGSVLGHLEDHLEGFVDLLPAIEHLVALAEELGREGNQLQPYVVMTLAGVLQGLAASRGRRDHPLRLPRETLAFDSQVEHQSPRNAFVAFAEELTEILDPDGLLVVLESSGGVIHSKSIATFNIVRAAPMLVYNPLYWVYAHEVAHGGASRLTLASLIELDEGAREPAERLLQLSDSASAGETSIESLGRALSRKILMRYGGSSNVAAELAEMIGATLQETLADGLLWASLAGPEGSSRDLQDRRFWFVYGPSLVYSTRTVSGARLSLLTAKSLILRWWLAERLLAGDSEVTTSWLQELVATLARWETNEPIHPHLERITEDVGAPEIWAPTPIALGFHCMALQRALAGRDQFPLEEAVERWLKLVRHLCSQTVLRSSARPSSVTNAYRGYLDELIAAWPSADPWVSTFPTDGVPRLIPGGGLAFDGRESALEADYQARTLGLLQRIDDLARDRRLLKLANYFAGLASSRL